ncbi:hypothetical protein AYL99_06261 [Fonsecaea erecta]|uniref:Cytochrome P450 n=1 Tax=Fonsecaea erecta TaxID=1367422 RepID=A0A178ZGN4_9EURO|nr:hypothetical protein AYL99_06261 [Fonsecaea erecta]OAP58964.1 hypothetical protein AYL99_06261 [Fonsecaea erecta]
MALLIPPMMAELAITTPKYLVLGILLLGIILSVAWKHLQNDRSHASLEGISEAPGALPVIGHLHLLGGRRGENDATMYSRWARATKSDLISCRIGDQVTVVVNTFTAVRELWVNQSPALVDRPAQPGFLDKVGVDITGSSLTDQIRRCRAASLKALGKSMWPEYYRLLEPSSEGLVFSLLAADSGLINLYPKLRTVIFDLGLSLTYGVRYGQFDEAFMDSFLQSILDITAVRASTANFRHYIKFLRWLPEWSSTKKTAEAAVQVRAAHVHQIYNAYLDRVREEGHVNCVVSSLGSDKLSEEEIHGTCLSLLQAAPDTIATGIYQCVAWLASPEGIGFQSTMYQAILDVYGGDRDLAWSMAFREEKVPLVTSLYKEGLRFFTVTPYSAPRQTTKDVQYKSAKIPRGTAVYMNAQQANHDPAHYGADAWSFNPTRFLGDTSPLPHVSFGAGGRICPAMALSNRLMSAFLVRLTLAFEMRLADPKVDKNARFPVIDGVRFSDVLDELVAAPRMYDCRFIPRDPAWLTELSMKAKAP